MTTSGAKKYDPTFQQHVGNRLRAWREAAGYTQEAVTKLFGYKSNASITRWEQGHYLPSFETLSKLAKLYGCTLDDLTP